MDDRSVAATVLGLVGVPVLEVRLGLRLGEVVLAHKRLDLGVVTLAVVVHVRDVGHHRVQTSGHVARLLVGLTRGEGVSLAVVAGILLCLRLVGDSGSAAVAHGEVLFKSVLDLGLRAAHVKHVTGEVDGAARAHGQVGDLVDGGPEVIGQGLRVGRAGAVGVGEGVSKTGLVGEVLAPLGNFRPLVVVALGRESRSGRDRRVRRRFGLGLSAAVTLRRDNLGSELLELLVDLTALAEGGHSGLDQLIDVGLGPALLLEEGGRVLHPGADQVGVDVAQPDLLKDGFLVR